MSKTLIICDSTCDLTLEQEQQYGLRIVNCGLEVGGMPYRERIEIDSAAVYRTVEETGELPHHSQVTVIEFLEEYLRAARDGYTDVLCVTMNAKGSGTHSAAQHAVNLLYEEHPELKETLTIRVIDSGTYSLPVAYGLIRAQERLLSGESPAVTAAYLEDLYQNSLTVIGLYSLQYAKKSGRLNACTAIVGDALGIKPIMTISGENKVIAKTRGDKNVIPKLAQLYVEMADDPAGDYVIAYGDDPDLAKQLAAAIKKLGGKAPAMTGPIGPCVACNAGPKMVGMGFRRKK